MTPRNAKSLVASAVDVDVAVVVVVVVIVVVGDAVATYMPHMSRCLHVSSASMSQYLDKWLSQGVNTALSQLYLIASASIFP